MRSRAIRVMRAAGASLALVAMLQACSQPRARKPRTTAEAPPGGVLLRGAGATFPERLYKDWFATYQKQHPAVAIAYEGVGSGEGVQRFLAKDVADDDRVDFGASDAAMTDEQIAATPGGALLLPVTAGMVVLAYNLPDMEEDLRLSRAACEGIFLGEVTRWDDPVIRRANPGVKLPSLTITTAVRQDSSGTTFAFTKHLDAIGRDWSGRYGAAALVAWPGSAMRARGNEGVAALVQRSPGSIGYVDFASARAARLRTALLENREGRFVRPTAESGAAALAAVELPENLRLFVPDPPGAESYPITTLTWILAHRTYDDPGRANALRGLLRWCLVEGQDRAPELGYLRLPEAVATRALAALDSIEPRQVVSR
jgi:phosphate transport system substrate-binding protein